MWSAGVSDKSHSCYTYPLIEEDDSIVCLNASLHIFFNEMASSIHLYHFLLDEVSLPSIDSVGKSTVALQLMQMLGERSQANSESRFQCHHLEFDVTETTKGSY